MSVDLGERTRPRVLVGKPGLALPRCVTAAPSPKRSSGRTIVTNRLSGNFPGSPIELEFVFTLNGDKITSP